jgi:hypothetical protein
MNEKDAEQMLENKITEFEANGFDKISCSYRYFPSHSTKVYNLDGSESLQVYPSDYRFGIILEYVQTSNAKQIEDITKKIFNDAFVMIQPNFFDFEEKKLNLVTYFIKLNNVPLSGTIMFGNDATYANNLIKRLIKEKGFDDPKIIR